MDTISASQVGTLTEAEQEALTASVREQFHTATSPYLRSLMAGSLAIAKQFNPSYLEGVAYGRPDPFEAGRKTAGIYGLERIYEDRVLLTPFFGCASYCRYCFKKTRTLGGPNTTMTDENLTAAFAYIRGDARIDTVLLTGGDPLAKPELSLRIIDEVVRIPHVNKIRIGTRHILFQPSSLTDELAQRLAAFNRIDDADPRRSKNVSLAISINHPDELAPDVVRAVRRFVDRGVAVRGQIVLLKGINDRVDIIRRLLDTFLAIGVTPYYIAHCMDVIGSYHMRTSVRKGCDLLAALERFSTAYALPYIYDTPVGKHRVPSAAALKYETIDGRRYVVATTPYRTSDFLEFSGQSSLPPLHEENADGFVVSRYLDGDDEAVPGW